MLRHVDPFHDLFDFPLYLFKAPSDSRTPEFASIEWELLQLNNFFYGIQEFASGRRDELRGRLKELYPGTDIVTDEDGCREHWTDTVDVIPISYYQLPFWEEVADFITPATQLLLLYVLTEVTSSRRAGPAR